MSAAIRFEPVLTRVVGALLVAEIGVRSAETALDARRAIADNAGAMLGFPPVTEELLGEAVSRMLAVGRPERIVLFGSRARGDARPDSDLDLLVIEASALPRYRRSPKYLRALVGLFPAKDVVVWTPEEVAAWADVPHAFITTALREGRTLYERAA